MTHQNGWDGRRHEGASHWQNRNGARAAAGITDSVENFTGVNTLQTASLLLGTGSGKSNGGVPTTQTHSTTSTSSKFTSSPTTTSSPTSSSDSSTATSSITPSQGPVSQTTTTWNWGAHKLLLAGIIAGFVALLIVVSLLIWFCVRRSKTKRKQSQEEELARQSFAAGALLSRPLKGKEMIPMGEPAKFTANHTKKGSRADDWKGLNSQDDLVGTHYSASPRIDEASLRSGGYRSPYTTIYEHHPLGGLAHQASKDGQSPLDIVAGSQFALVGAFNHALSAEDDDDREPPSSHSHAFGLGVPRIERGPQLRVAQASAHPHPFADPSLVARHGTHSYGSTESSPTRVEHELGHPEQTLMASGDETERKLRPAEEARASFLSFTPSSAHVSDNALHNAAAAESAPPFFDTPTSLQSPPRVLTVNPVPPSPTSVYSQATSPYPSGIPAQRVSPGPVDTQMSRAGATLQVPSPLEVSSPSDASAESAFTTSRFPQPPVHVGLQARSNAPSRQERANNMRALGELIAALDGVGPGSDPAPAMTPSTESGHGTSGGRSLMPDAGLWRAALGSSPTLGARKGSDNSSSRKR
ncbi:hypothetical protein DL93DRAFT_795139 [Clavulina sp. PMI_390]|nr:hypothetical protein DL93DRAFT_795139 [Clavulina sp. PMI_390]